MSLYDLPPDPVDIVPFSLPDSYIVLDTKGTGLNQDDLILRIDHLIVKNGEISDQQYFLLNWPLYEHRFSREDLENLLSRPSNHSLSYDDLNQGTNPYQVLKYYRDLITQNSRIPLVGHALYTVDLPLLRSHFTTWLGDITFDADSLFLWDVGLMEKAIGSHTAYWEGDSMAQYHWRLAHSRVTDVHWSLAYCIEHYDVKVPVSADDPTYPLWAAHGIYQAQRTLLNGRLAAKEEAIGAHCNV